jgi:PIN domain nuclease of toxin-antitoxin system
LWWSLEHPRLASKARDAIASEDAEVMISAASIWELAIKVRSGKLPQAGAFVASVQEGRGIPGIAILPITAAHAVHAGLLAVPHRDPFDRMLIAQAQLEGLSLVSNERLFDRFGVIRIWD